MALHTLTDDGHLAWDCGGCGKYRAAHVSHEDVQHTDESMIGLPACEDCGSRMFLKVKYTSQELQSPEMHDQDGNPTQSYMAAQMHMALVKHMRDVGKAHDSIPEGDN